MAHGEVPYKYQLSILNVSNLDTLKVVPGSHEGGRIPAQILVVILHVKAQAEEDVVPDEHLHLGLLPRVDGHHVSLS